jgi:putative ABC transport system permease protein
MLSAGLLVRSYQRLTAADPGFVARDVLSFRLTLPPVRYKGPVPVIQFYDELERRIAALPGVVAVGTNYQLPLSAVGLAWEPIGIEGRVPRAPGDERLITSSAYVSPGYFAAMRIRLLAGRGFAAQDDRDALPVVIVDDRLAKRFWPGESAIGKRLRQGDDGPWRTVVGVIANTREYEPSAQPPITAFFPVRQYGIGSRYVVVRTAPGRDAGAALAAVLGEVRALDPDLPAYDVATMPARVSASLARQRLSTLVLGAFALAALVLCTVGVYGVVSHWVAGRRREIAVRAALGATAPRIRGLVLRELGIIAGAGIVVGLAGGVVVARAARSLLYRVGSTDAVTYLAATVLIAATALVAAWIPARRAARVHPASVLREE